MIYAPVLITTLCRDVHFIRLIESLKRNTWAKYTDVFIGLDFPPSEKYREGYNRICQYLESNFDDFRSFNVIKRTKNYGSLKNMTDLREMVLKTHDRFIRTDDDAEFSPNFLEYMNKCLMKYEDDPNVVAVTGYSYPINWSVSKNANILKENFSCPMWGTGFWKDKYLKICDYIIGGKLIEKQNDIIKGRIQNMMHRAQWEYMNMCISSEYKRTLASKLSDISFRMYLSVEDKSVIVPTVSKVRNWGFDGTGEYCQEVFVTNSKVLTSHTYPYNSQPIDYSGSFNVIEDLDNNNRLNRKIMNQFDTLPLKYIVRTKFKIILYRILGHKIYNWLILNNRK